MAAAYEGRMERMQGQRERRAQAVEEAPRRRRRRGGGTLKVSQVAGSQPVAHAEVCAAAASHLTRFITLATSSQNAH